MDFKEINDKISAFRLPRWHEIPSIGLYLSQTIMMIEDWLQTYTEITHEKVLTKTMVNNYVKEKIIRAPQNKMYDQVSIASLLVISILKSNYNINDISKLISIALEVDNPEASYNRFCDAIEKAVKQAFCGQISPPIISLTDEQYLMQNVGYSFAGKLYVQAALMARGLIKAE